MSDISVLNVYETAADIGREVENVIDECGSEAMSNLMPYIIRVLEQLETLVAQKEQDRGRIERLEEDLLSTAKDGVRKNEDNLALQMEIRQLEELIKNEEMDLMNVADKVQRENRQLKEELSEKQKLNVTDMVQEQETIRVLNQLKETVDKQRDDVRIKDAELRAKTEETEALQQQVERMFKVNSNLHRKNQRQEEIAKNLIHEKSKLQSELADALKQAAEVPVIPVVHVVNAGRLPEVHDSQGVEEDVARTKSTTVATSSSQSEDVQDDDKNMQWVNLEGKMIIDKKDPNRPRFTLKEMAHVLEERDNMKMKVMEMEDELEVYRPKENTALLTPVQQRLRADSTPKRDRADSGIKRFFSGFLKKLSPQKKLTSGYKDGAWEVLNPSEDIIKSSDLFREEEMTSPIGDVVTGIVEEDDKEVEEVRLHVFLGEPITSMPDGDLNKSLDTNHFAGAVEASRLRSGSAGSDDDSDVVEETTGTGVVVEEVKDKGVVVEEMKDNGAVVEESKTDSSVESAIPSQCLITPSDTDINGNTDECSSSSQPETSRQHPGDRDEASKQAS